VDRDVDTLTFGQVSKLNSVTVNDKTDGNDQFET
jgi:hypothetical protein